MFYFVVLAWLIGCALVCLARRMRTPQLVTSCPCAALAGILGGVLLIVFDKVALGIIVLVVGLSISAIFGLTALTREKSHQEINS
jgi:hypothetical protein